MTAVAVAQRFPFSQSAVVPPVVPTPAPLSLREAVSQVNYSSRNLLGLMALANAAERDLNSGSPETTLDSVISKAVLRSLLGALHYRDFGTLRHSRRVALLATGLAHHLGWQGRHLRLLEVAALLHDIGKIGVPDNVLYKPGKLSSEEMELMELHHGIGLNVLQACRVDSDVLRIVDQSHRAYTPSESDNQSNQDVHIGARILAVADAYESLCTEKVYRHALSHDEIMNLLTAASGKQFDANVVNSLARWVQKEGLPFAAQSAEMCDVSNRAVPVSLEEAAEAMALCQIFSYLYMLESLYDGFRIVDTNRRFVVWNRGIERLVGQSASQMLGTAWSADHFASSSRNKIEKNSARTVSSLDNAIESRKSVICQWPFERKDGTTVQVELQTVPLLDAKGQLHGVAEIFRNLSRTSKGQGLSQAPELKRLKLQASRDALTSVANRGELERQLRQMADHFQETPNDPFCVIFADADHFKRVNDTYGHQVGDQVLIDLAKHLSEETYSGEIVGRYGGEEFVILCPGTQLDQAVRRADRLRASLPNAKVGGIDKLKITCSFGVSQIESGDSTETVLRRADLALYAAKKAGRDRTCSYTSEQLLAMETGEILGEKVATRFHFKGEFDAVLASEMVIHKLAGFVKEHLVELGDVTRERVVMRLHGAGWFACFGSSPNRQGLQIELQMENASRADGRQKMQIKVEMLPIGRYRNSHDFDLRSKLVMKELKQYFAAE